MDTIETRIEDCHRMIEEQCERLAKQVRLGMETEGSRLFLECLCLSLRALERSQAVFEGDEQRRQSRDTPVRPAEFLADARVPGE